MIKLKTFFSIVGSGLNQASLICNPVRMNNFLFKKFLTLFKCRIIFLLEWPNSTDPTLLLEGAICQFTVVIIILNHSFVLAFQKTTRVNNRDTSGIGVDLLNHQNTLSFFSSHLNIRIFFNLSIFLFLQSSLSLFQLVICFSSCKYNIFLLQNLVINFYFQHR